MTQRWPRRVLFFYPTGHHQGELLFDSVTQSRHNVLNNKLGRDWQRHFSTMSTLSTLTRKNSMEKKICNAQHIPERQLISLPKHLTLKKKMCVTYKSPHNQLVCTMTAAKDKSGYSVPVPQVRSCVAPVLQITFVKKKCDHCSRLGI